MAYKRSYTSTKPTQQDNSLETTINLDAKKRVTVRRFNNVNLVDIREFYTDANGDQKPGKKGISLTEETYFKLIEAHNKIQHALDGLNGGGGAASKKAKVEKSEDNKVEPTKKEKVKEQNEAKKKKDSDGVKKEQSKSEQNTAGGGSDDDGDNTGDVVKEDEEEVSDADE
ncbi:hypothetical protein CORT_0E02870 [Candida orthopsilosis Co 90-125]|uniref:Transcriptional coactivator p15 (PC4) C-terminal domain-containing protein n=1 Tax=Candida orthopsilosis (strain 90-125) TaxID=1136231 RepID=H8X7T9_CANO9|nr:hypothetical protein CORT_0E02870 [Candida orthopsilosis Co 90-125]CCG23875.1 hypothetical protein CORT_0E02870 [Candida orthopsilosis Co 90-125]